MTKPETKICQNCKQGFTIEPDDFAFYEKMKVPAPTWCPDCRMQRREIWRNERVLHKAVCGLCKEKMLSMYDPKDGFNVYCDKCWWSDAWDPMDYGFSYDFGQPFFPQWRKLLEQTPLIQAWKFNNINPNYINYATDTKNCYLSSSIISCENVSYSYSVDKSEDTVDSLFSNKLVRCYENVDSLNNYNSIFLQNCNNCIDSGFLFDCINCQNCFLSCNLRNKKYVLRNVQYSKEEYETKMSGIKTGKFSVLRGLLSEMKEMKEKKSIHKYIQAVNAVGCSGNNIENSKNSINSFNVHNSENIKNSIRTDECKDVVDVFGAVQTELIYDSVAPAYQGSNARFCANNRASHGLDYCSFCSSSHNLFACIGLRNKFYCIFNKQYTKEEYGELVPKIIKHMNDVPYLDNKGRVYKHGEFLPSEVSPFCYNESLAQEYFPLTKQEASDQGYRWRDEEERKYTIDIRNEDIPDDINEVNEEITGRVIECEHKGECNEQCTEAFKIVPQELQFYKKMNLPLPHLCPNCRHYERLAQRNPMKLWHRQCMCEKNHSHHSGKCPNEFETSYAPGRTEIVYCEQCYQSEVI